MRTLSCVRFMYDASSSACIRRGRVEDLRSIFDHKEVESFGIRSFTNGKPRCMGSLLDTEIALTFRASLILSLKFVRREVWDSVFTMTRNNGLSRPRGSTEIIAMSLKENLKYRSWVEVDLGNFAANWAEMKRLVGPAVKIMQVVKADAYGHGAIEISNVALGNGASCLGVANADEGVQLRVSGITAPVIILSPATDSEIDQIIKYNLTPSVSDLGFAREFQKKARKAGIRAPIHVEVDTGMGRGGTIQAEACRSSGRSPPSPTSAWKESSPISPKAKSSPTITTCSGAPSRSFWRSWRRTTSRSRSATSPTAAPS